MRIALDLILIILITIDIITNIITDNQYKKVRKYLNSVSKQSLEIQNQIKFHQQQILNSLKTDQ